MAILRFANPGSDFERMIYTYRSLHRVTHDREFDLDQAIRALIDSGQVSSSGAIGEEALRRSTRKDRSRDPLYNQLKMYSELYRLLGWLHPVGARLTFRHTLLGEHIAEDVSPRTPQMCKLFQECLLGISFPNPNTKNIGISRLRFFPLLLRFMDELGGITCRDEIIVGLYSVTDDCENGLLEQRIEVVEELRGASHRLTTALQQLANDNSVQTNTLKNYTRFPLGVLKSPLVDWASDVRVSDLYEQPKHCYRLADTGRDQLRRFSEGLDLRRHHVAQLDSRSRALVANIGFYAMLHRAGFEVDDEILGLQRALNGFPDVASLLGEHSVAQVYYSPFQQADHADIAHAMVLWDELDVTA